MQAISRLEQESRLDRGVSAGQRADAEEPWRCAKTRKL
jgi:hypothetical protein